MTNKDTNSQDSIQVGNESIQTMQSVEKEEVMENCQQCGSYICKCEVKDFVPQSNTLEKISQKWDKQARELHECGEISNTLGTTIEERLATEYKEYENREVELSREKIIRFWLKELAQSKTDLLNALIERENREKKDIITEHPTTTLEFLEEGQILGFNQAKTDTINHLKSLRDETKN